MSKKRTIIEERRKMFAPILAARQAELMKKAEASVAARKQQELELQKSIEKSQAAAAALRAAKEAEEAERLRKIEIYRQYNEQQAFLASHRHSLTNQFALQETERVLLEKSKAENLRRQEAELEDKKRKAATHPLKRILSQPALRAWMNLDLDSQLQILSSFENIQDFEFKVRTNPLELNKKTEQPPLEADTQAASVVPSP